MLSHIIPVPSVATKDHEAKFGGYNDLPLGWREVSEAEFVKTSFWTRTPSKVEFRQLIGKGIVSAAGGPLHDARLYFFSDDTGVAMMSDFRAGKIRFFAFGCAHKYREIGAKEAGQALHRCEHAYLCDACGHKMVVDSSD